MLQRKPLECYEQSTSVLQLENMSMLASWSVDGVFNFVYDKKIIGDGVNTRFWKDVWLGNYMLHTAFPRLYALEEDKDVTVADKFSQPWNASFRRPMLGGAEAAQGQELSVLLNTVHLNQLPDKWVWDLSSDGRFTVASARHYLDDTLLGGSFAWKMMCDALPTQIPDKLVRWWGFSTYSFPSLRGWKGWMDGVRLRNKMKEVLEESYFSSEVFSHQGYDSCLLE
ncbi:hypothetical protein LXL04_033120 [Taraxacum kok-saghyz]